MNLLIVVPDGVGIKNYLYSDFLEKLLQAPDIQLTIVTRLDPDFIRELFDGIELTIYPLPVYKEGAWELLMRESVRFARLQFFANQLQNDAILGYSSQGGSAKKKLLLNAAKRIGAVLCSSGFQSILNTEEKYWKRLAKKEMPAFQHLFEQIKPDVILSTHQRPLDNIPMFEMARRLGVKTSSVIYSWDNVAKAALNARAEVYFVWSSFMLDQMKLFHPEIDPSRVKITGTPQFSFYRNPAYHTSRELFCTTFGLPADRQIVVFSGSDSRTSPYDPELLADVYQVIENAPVESRPVLVFRRSPADFSGRYDSVLHRHPEIISLDPIWINKGNSWITAIPTRDDIKNMVGLMQHCSLIINVSSTVALDGATLNKPTIYLAYSPDSAPHFDYAKKIHVEDHLKVLQDIDGVAYVFKKDKLSDTINGILTNPDAFCKDRSLFLRRITDDIIIDSGINIISELRSLVPEAQPVA